MHPPTSRNRLGAGRTTPGGVGIVRSLAVFAWVALLAVGNLYGQVSNPPPPIKDKTQSPSSPAQAQPPSPASPGQTQTPPAAAEQAQTQPPLAPGKIESKVKTVTLYATVRDKHGKIVSTLNKEDFSLDEDGKPQTIAFFTRESDVPLTLGPLVDTSMSQRHVLGAERDASYAFLDDILRADKDKAFLIHFDHQVELLQDLTSSREKLKKAIGLLDTPDDDQGGGGGGGGGRGSRGAGTQLYDAIFLASNELMKKQQGRKALIILSDGVDHGSKESLVEAIDSAQLADTAVYSILFAGEEDHDRGRGFGRGGGIGHGGGGGYPGGGYPGGGGGGGGGGYPGGGQRRTQDEGENGKKTLERISAETGGRFFEVSKKLTVDQIYAQIEEELRNQYSIGYTPSPADSSGGYHKIHVTLKDKDLAVAAREGYYSTP